MVEWRTEKKILHIVSLLCLRKRQPDIVTIRMYTLCAIDSTLVRFVEKEVMISSALNVPKHSNNTAGTVRLYMLLRAAWVAIYDT